MIFGNKFNLKIWFLTIVFLVVVFYFGFYKVAANAQVMNEEIYPYIATPTQPALDENFYLGFGVFNDLDPTDYEFCVYLPKHLQYKSRGNDVTALQNYLLDRGFLELSATGFYGRATELAIKKFQYKNEIDVTGKAEALTRETIKSLTCSELTYTKMVTLVKKTSPANRTYQDIDFTTATEEDLFESKDRVIPITDNLAPINKKRISTSSIVIPTTDFNLDHKIITTPTTTQANPLGMNTNVNNNRKLKSTSGIFSSTNKNNLYVIYQSHATAPGICLTLNNTDCNDNSNFQELIDGNSSELFEATTYTTDWLITLHNNPVWGNSGDRVRIYFKDGPKEIPAIYTVTVQ